ncbi:2'-5' RNA ligase family protein [Ottowia sp.]|uniref:2'-5' RNA ligase family protein n=1 Tax=Ottowia sp. TaxID=1898956 RepID=UPI0039E2B508
MSELPIPVAPRRLFTALFPDAAACAAVDAERRRWPGLPSRLHPVPERMHLTLQFFGQVPAPAEQAWLRALAALRFEPFEIVLDHAELWQAPSGVIAVLRPAPNPALDELHRATARLARQAGLPAAMQGFRPHLTTLRRARVTERLPLRQPIGWTVRAVDLIWSDLHAQPPRYHRLGRFPAA